MKIPWYAKDRFPTRVVTPSGSFYVPSAFIANRTVLCVNAHDDLVGALNSLVKLHSDMRKGEVVHEVYAQTNDVLIAEARAALTKATGEPQ